MGHYLRYITIDSRPVSLDSLASAFQEIDNTYVVYQSDTDSKSGDLYYGDTLLGILEINGHDEEIFTEDIADLKELVAAAKNTSVWNILDQAKSIIAVEAIWQGNKSEVTLEKLEPLWDWLFARYEGLLQVDNEGFFDRDDLILELHLKI
jgi:hypothetical protein